MAASGGAGASDESLKLAIAVSLFRSKFMKSVKDSNALSPSRSDALLRWKQKAKQRKLEILRLREDLNQVQDASHCDHFPESASCKCYFFDNLGELNPKHHANDSISRFNDVLRRRFLRQVRFKERKRKLSSSSSSTQQRLSIGLTEEDETEQLKASVDFLVELCETVSPVDHSKFANLAHQAVDFILVSLKNLLSLGRNLELLEGIINSLVTRLIRQICSHLSENGSKLIEFLVADYLSEWSKAEDFDSILYEDWMTSIIQARKALELLESRNGLYTLYMDRVTGELVKYVGGVSLLQKLKPDIFNHLFDKH